MFEIRCKELTKERKKILAEREVMKVSKPMRGVMAAGGVWIFYYGTDANIPASVQVFATVFAIVGLTLVILAIFAQILVEMNYFSKSTKIGCFPAEVSVGKGGVFVKRRITKKDSEIKGVTSVNKEQFYAYAEVGKAEEYEYYFKLNLLREGTPSVFLFKEDFGKGDPEAFKLFINTK